MSAMSDYLETAVLNHLFGGSALSQPTVHIALFTSAPSDSGGGTELSGSGYARISPAFTVASDNASNTAAADFAAATGSWGTITHVGLFDASTSGNLLFHGALSTSRAIGSGDVFRFNAGDLDITLA